MRILDLLKKDSIDLDGPVLGKKETINHLAGLMDRSRVEDLDSLIRAVEKREEEGTTAIGDHVALPHGKAKGVKEACLSAMVVKEGTDYDSLDGEATKLFFMIAVPEGKNDEHLRVLSRLSTLLVDEDFRKSLIGATSKDEFLKIIDLKEKEKFPEDYKEEKKEKVAYDLVAVTACPTGIAHTYMSAEALTKKAEEMGYRIKVETNGSVGVENPLTREDIKNAKAVIIAADKNVNKERFSGKKLVETGVSEGIHHPEKLIERALSDQAKVYGQEKTRDGDYDDLEESKGHSFYKHLMNGVSHMLPFVIGGGILIALAFLLDDYTIDPANFGSNTPVAKMFNTIGGTAFSFMLPILSGFIAMSIADRPGLAVGFIGGALAASGGSGFLGALVAGFLAGYLTNGLKKVFGFLPKSLDGIKPVLLYPLFGILFIGLLLELVINPPLASLNEAIIGGLNSMGSTSKILLGFLLGGMMAVDMGGPINKAAYVFGTASLANGSSDMMAAVMVGGMVPPLALAFASMVFKNKFTDKERQSSLTNIIMGLSFITEGAIPFAAADPLHVIPPLVLGSGVAGAMSMAFGSSLRAPHGGLWVIGVIEKPLGFILALVVGSLVGMVLLGLMKKEVETEK